jgi:putative transposase
MKLNLRRKSKKRLPARVKRELFQPEAMNEVWSVDFMSDSLWNGKKIRLLNVIDNYNREILWIETDTSLPTHRVIRTLEVLKELITNQNLLVKNLAFGEKEKVMKNLTAIKFRMKA